MREIYSPSNNEIRFVKNLAEKSFRDETKMFFAEGMRNVLDILKVSDFNSVNSIFITEKFTENQTLNAFYDKLILTNDICIQKMSATKTSQGIIAVLKQPDFCDKICDRTVLLDGLTDGGNIGTIIRTSVAADYGVILKDCADIFSPKVVRSCMSAILKAKLYKFDKNILGDLKQAGVCFYAGDMDGENIFDIKVRPQKLCLVIGNEAMGISGDIKKICDKTVSIPMENMESLNASISAAILMYNLKYL